MKAFTIHFLERVAGRDLPRSLTVSAPELNRTRGLWMCLLELPGVLKLPARAYGMPPVGGGDSSGELAQLAALQIARELLKESVLFTPDGAPFVVPSSVPTE